MMAWRALSKEAYLKQKDLAQGLRDEVEYLKDCRKTKKKHQKKSQK